MRLELTLPALERLLGGDTEMEVHLRQQVVEEFARKKIKTLINDATLAKVSALWRAELDTAVKAEIDGLLAEKAAAAAGPTRIASIRSSLRAAIEAAAQQEVASAMAAAVEQRTRYLDRTIAATVSRAISEAVAATIDSIMAAELAAAIKDRFGGLFDELVEAEIRRRLDAARAMSPTPPAGA